jgi:repressor LexA
MFIHERLEETGISPSFEEMKTALDLRSKSGIHRLIVSLEERGFIRRLPHRARALEVLKLPQQQSTGGRRKTDGVRVGGDDVAPFTPSVVQGNFKPPMAGRQVEMAEDNEAISLPLYGRIAAGTPIEALSDPERVVEVPASMLGRGEHYALEISGTSMIEAGILDGDVAVIERGDTADNGQIVVALVDDSEATLKRLRRKGKSIALEPANSDFETRIFGPDRVKVQGRLVALLRHY